MQNTKVIAPILLTFVGLGVGFGGGYFVRGKLIQRQRAAFGTTGNIVRFGNNQRIGQNGMMVGRNAVIGSVLSIDEKGITVKLTDGSSKIILFTDSTSYSNTVSATKADIKTGANIAVFGAPNSDGSVTATTVQINPEFGKMMQTPQPK